MENCMLAFNKKSRTKGKKKKARRLHLQIVHKLSSTFTPPPFYLIPVDFNFHQAKKACRKKFNFNVAIYFDGAIFMFAQFYGFFDSGIFLAVLCMKTCNIKPGWERVKHRPFRRHKKGKIYATFCIVGERKREKKKEERKAIFSREVEWNDEMKFLSTQYWHEYTKRPFDAYNFAGCSWQWNVKFLSLSLFSLSEGRK